MARPSYISNGGIAVDSDGQSVAISYPSIIETGDILFALVNDSDDDEFDTPDGWHYIGHDGASTNSSYALYWKRAIGNESGTVTFTSALASGQLTMGCIYRFSGCKQFGRPFNWVGQKDVVSGVSGLLYRSTALFNRRMY